MVGTLRNLLVGTIDECAEKIVYLMEYPELAEELGKEGMTHINKTYSCPG